MGFILYERGFVGWGVSVLGNFVREVEFSWIKEAVVRG